MVLAQQVVCWSLLIVVMKRWLLVVCTSFMLGVSFFSWAEEVLRRLQLKGQIPHVLALSVNGQGLELDNVIVIEKTLTVDSQDIASRELEFEEALYFHDLMTNLPITAVFESIEYFPIGRVVDKSAGQAAEWRVRRVEAERGSLGSLSEEYVSVHANQEFLQLGRITEEGFYRGLSGGEAWTDIRLPLIPGKHLPGMYVLQVRFYVRPTDEEDSDLDPQ